jgi:hypothetical protein
MRSSLLLALSFSFVTACAASIDPAMRASVDQQLAAITPADTVFPAPTSSTPMPLAVGQWTKLKLVDKNGRPSFTTYKVVGQDGDATWVEVVTEQYTGRTVLKMLVAFGDRTDVNKVAIRRVILKQRDRAPIEYEQPVLGMVQGTYKSVARALVLRWDGLGQETKRAPAGTFTGAFTAEAEVSLFGYSSRAKTWSHTAVPVQGLVHSDNDDGSTIDLVEFGLTGATSEL